MSERELQQEIGYRDPAGTGWGIRVWKPHPGGQWRAGNPRRSGVYLIIVVEGEQYTQDDDEPVAWCEEAYWHAGVKSWTFGEIAGELVAWWDGKGYPRVAEVVRREEGHRLLAGATPERGRDAVEGGAKA